MSLRKFYLRKYTCPQSVLRAIYFSNINSKLQYGSCQVGAYLVTLNPLLVAQKSEFHIFMGQSFTDAKTSAFFISL